MTVFYRTIPRIAFSMKLDQLRDLFARPDLFWRTGFDCLARV